LATSIAAGALRGPPKEDQQKTALLGAADRVSKIDGSEDFGVDQQFSEAQVAITTGAAVAEYLGTGSYGETWRIEFSDGRSVARKFLYKDGYDVDRLAREVEGLRRVDSPFVVELLGVGDITFRKRAVPYLDFEFIAGGSLENWIANNGKVTEREAVGLASGLLLGVAALHEAQVLHRDIKPANIGLRDGDLARPVLLDLGLAKLLDLESITQYPSHVGTAMYMSPEQLRGERAGKGADVWAVGVVLHEVLSRRHPFFRDGEKLTLAEVLERLASPPALSSATPALQRLVTRCLLPEPYQRGNAARAYNRFEKEVGA
jgi:eukaryotic-like serine/threonine-protein kinase